MAGEEGRNPQVCTVAAKIGVFHTVVGKIAFELEAATQLVVVHTGSVKTVFALAEETEAVVVVRIGFGRNAFALAGAMWAVEGGYIDLVRIEFALAVQTLAGNCLDTSMYWDCRHPGYVRWQFGHYRIRALTAEKDKRSYWWPDCRLDVQAETARKAVVVRSGPDIDR